MAKVVKLEWAGDPRFEPRAIGEPADFTGKKILVLYDNGGSETVDVTFRMVNESNLQAIGPYRTSYVSYEGQRLTAEIPILDIRLESIKASARPGFSVRLGQLIDTKGIQVIAHFSDGSEREVYTFKTVPYKPVTEEDKEILIRYGKCRDTLLIDDHLQADGGESVEQEDPSQTPQEAQEGAPSRGRVSIPNQPQSPKNAAVAPDRTIRAVSVAMIPKKTVYGAQETVPDLSGGRLDLIYTDGTVGQIDMMPDAPATLSVTGAGKGKVSFTCFGHSVEYEVEVAGEESGGTPAALLSAMLASPPAKMVYVERETGTPDLTGAELLLQYADGSRKQVPVTMDMVRQFNISTPGNTMLELGYEGMAVVCPLLVVQKSVVDLKLRSSPRKTEYIDGEPYNLQGLILYAEYNNGEREPVADYDVDKTVAKEGDTSLTFSYQGIKITVPVTVKRLWTRSIEWIQKPAKIQYFQNEKIPSCDGGLIAVTKNDGGIQRVPLTPEMVTSFDTSLKGNTFVEVSLESRTLTYEIVVVERFLLGIRILTPPRIQYTAGEMFDRTGMIVLAQYAGGGTERIEVDVSPDRPLTEKDTQVILVYRDKAVVQSITVSPKPLEDTLDWSNTSDDIPMDEVVIAPEREDSGGTAEQEEKDEKEVMMPPFYPSSFEMRFLDAEEKV